MYIQIKNDGWDSSSFWSSKKDKRELKEKKRILRVALLRITAAEHSVSLALPAEDETNSSSDESSMSREALPFPSRISTVQKQIRDRNH